jgi:hypothetical protein
LSKQPRRRKQNLGGVEENGEELGGGGLEGRGKDAINDHRNGVGRKGAEAALEGGDCTLSHGGDGLAGAAAPEPDRRAEGGRTKTLLLFFSFYYIVWFFIVGFFQPWACFSMGENG